VVTLCGHSVVTLCGQSVWSLCGHSPLELVLELQQLPLERCLGRSLGHLGQHAVSSSLK